MARRRYGVLTLGRSGVDVYPLQVGRRLEDVETFGKFLGGSPTNVAVAAARLGESAAVVTAVGTDPFGRFVRREIRRFGVADEFVVEIPGAQTPVTFCEILPPDDSPLWFYRSPTLPHLCLTPADVDLDAVRGARLVWLTASGLSTEPSRAAHRAELDARAGREHTVLDLDYRAAFWPDEATARREVAAALPAITVAVGNRDECRVVLGEDDPDRAADALLDTGVRLAVVKMGRDGALAKTRTERVEVPACAVTVVNGIGAGDGFGGALCHGLLAGWPLRRTVEFANAAGALVATRLECAGAMPSVAEVEALLHTSARRTARTA
jgi:5-dehydro-2-deoxygluconokinase